MSARIEAGWLIAPVKRRQGFGGDAEVQDVDACAWIGSSSPVDVHTTVRKLVKPCSANLSHPEATGALIDIGGGTLKSAKVDCVDANDKSCKAYFRIPVKGGSASDQGVSTPQLARGEAAGSTVVQSVPGSATSNKPAAITPILPITVVSPPPAPGYATGTPEVLKIRAMVRIDLGSPKISIEWNVKGKWKAIDPALHAALTALETESRESVNVGWRVCLVQGDNAIQVAAGEATGIDATEALASARAAALLAVDADPVAPLPISTPEAPKEAGTVVGKPVEKPAKK